MNKYLNSATVLAIITTTLYVSGVASYHGYLLVLDLDSDMMERSFNLTLYRGFIVIFVELIWAAYALIIVLVLNTYLFIPVLLWYMKRGFKQSRRIIKIKRMFKYRVKIQQDSATRLTNTLVVFSCIVFTVFSLSYIENKGRTRAYDLLKRSAEGKLTQSDMVTRQIEGRILSLLNLGCGMSHCAGMEIGNNKIHYFPKSQPYSFELEPKGGSQITD